MVISVEESSEADGSVTADVVQEGTFALCVLAVCTQGGSPGSQPRGSEGKGIGDDAWQLRASI